MQSLGLSAEPPQSAPRVAERLLRHRTARLLESCNKTSYFPQNLDSWLCLSSCRSKAANEAEFLSFASTSAWPIWSDQSHHLVRPALGLDLHRLPLPQK
jgi:hypothetical protein